MRDLEIRGAGNLLGAEQSGHIAAVGFDLYVEMVTEAVGELTGEVREHAGRGADRPARRPRTCPRDYIARDDVRMEAYRRLAAVTTPADVDDVRGRVGRPLRPAAAARARRCSTSPACGPSACASASARCRCRRAGPASTAGTCSSRRRCGCSAWSPARQVLPDAVVVPVTADRRRLDRPGVAQVARHDQRLADGAEQDCRPAAGTAQVPSAG